jgi:hypothetical protein
VPALPKPSARPPSTLDSSRCDGGPSYSSSPQRVQDGSAPAAARTLAPDLACADISRRAARSGGISAKGRPACRPARYWRDARSLRNYHAPSSSSSDGSVSLTMRPRRRPTRAFSTRAQPLILEPLQVLDGTIAAAAAVGGHPDGSRCWGRRGCFGSTSVQRLQRALTAVGVTAPGRWHPIAGAAYQA